MSDVKIDYLCSDEQQFLTAKGDISKDEMIWLAKEQNVIDKDDESFDDGDYSQSWYKVVPKPNSWSHKSWRYPVDKQCRGAYFASVIVIG